MTTEELKALGLDETQIKEVFRLHGLVVSEFKDLENENKILNSEKENLELQLKNANEKIEEFKDLDVDAIKKEAEDYKQKYEESTVSHQSDIDRLKRDFSIESALMGAKVKNTKAAKALLDMDALTTAEDFNKAIEAQIKGIRETDAYLFQPAQGSGSIGGTGNPEKPKENMTYSEMMDYLSTHPGAEI